MGANRSTGVVEKATWILAIALIVLSLASNFARPTGEQEATGTESRLKTEEMTTTAPAAQPQQQAEPTSVDTTKK
jgi:preprotein translocase subunit SecG